jgi:nicotinate-nucleotide pyrophosphorylase (carboxylating)
MKSVPFAPLDPALYREAVRRALAEDLGWGDVTTEATVDPLMRARGVIVAKCECVLAGLDVAAEAFRQLDPGAVFSSAGADGDRCLPGTIVAEVRGSAAAMLTAERTALNFLQRLSGVATITRRFVDAAGGAITILDTRKTTPTLRALEKYAVRAGGGTNHRSGLDDGILIKDNHIRLAGGVTEVVRRMKAAHQEMLIEIEAQSLEQVDAAVAAGADVILLDNLPLEETREAVRRIGGRAKIELSGGVTLDRIPELARTGADYVSVGALTHSAPAADLSFELEPDWSSGGPARVDPSAGASAKGDLSAGASAKPDLSAGAAAMRDPSTGAGAKADV